MNAANKFRRSGITYVAMPDAARLSPADIEALASRVAQVARYQDGGDLYGAVSQLGGKIHVVDMQDWNETMDGSILVHGKSPEQPGQSKDWPLFDIILGWFSGPMRDRFTIAHEIGHFILHSRSGKHAIQMARDGGRNPLEWEANQFAASFLMPLERFTQYWNEYRDLDVLAGRFQVSTEAARVRKERLGLD
ncbi:MAG: ImmA/IrrE family metallo-endopeptidase [Magnetococcus sp. WYHC-3]